MYPQLPSRPTQALSGRLVPWCALHLITSPNDDRHHEVEPKPDFKLAMIGRRETGSPSSLPGTYAHRLYVIGHFAPRYTATIRKCGLTQHCGAITSGALYQCPSVCMFTTVTTSASPKDRFENLSVGFGRVCCVIFGSVFNNLHQVCRDRCGWICSCHHSEGQYSFSRLAIPNSSSLANGVSLAFP